MHSVKVHNGIIQITSLFYFLGLWHRGEKATVGETIFKFFYLIYYMLFLISFMAGISSDSNDESIFLVEGAILISVLSLKLYYILWKKKQILKLLNRICVYSSLNDDEFIIVQKKLKRLTKFVIVLLATLILVCSCASFVVPFLGSDRKLFFNIGFPLDWKNNGIAFWIAFTFILTEVYLSTIIFLFTIITWYVLINCSLKYEVLGNQIRNTGALTLSLGPIEATGKRRIMTQVEKQNIYFGNLIEAVKSHNDIKNSVSHSESFFSMIFLVQLGTSGICICGSIYCLVFSIGDNLMEYFIYLFVLFYNIFEIFMVMYFGNEIRLSSDSLSYCLFESNWMEQSQSTKKHIIIFGEMVKQSHVLNVVGKLYPLTLDTFTRILKSVYSMFNILKNLNQH